MYFICTSEIRNNVKSLIFTIFVVAILIFSKCFNGARAAPFWIFKRKVQRTQNQWEQLRDQNFGVLWNLPSWQTDYYKHVMKLSVTDYVVWKQIKNDHLFTDNNYLWLHNPHENYTVITTGLLHIMKTLVKHGV